MNLLVQAITVSLVAWRRLADSLRSWYWTAELRRHAFPVGPGLTVKKGAAFTFGRGAQISIGANVTLAEGARVHVGDGARLKLGGGVFVGAHSLLAARSEIEVGENSQIAHNATLIDHDHDRAALASGRPEAVGKAAPIRIGRNAWVGANALVLKGVALGDSAVLAAGAVATKSVPSGAVARGPAAQFHEASGNAHA